MMFVINSKQSLAHGREFYTIKFVLNSVHLKFVVGSSALNGIMYTKKKNPHFGSISNPGKEMIKLC